MTDTPPPYLVLRETWLRRAWDHVTYHLSAFWRYLKDGDLIAYSRRIHDDPLIRYQQILCDWQQTIGEHLLPTLRKFTEATSQWAKQVPR